MTCLLYKPAKKKKKNSLIFEKLNERSHPLIARVKNWKIARDAYSNFYFMIVFNFYLFVITIVNNICRGSQYIFHNIIFHNIFLERF